MKDKKILLSGFVWKFMERIGAQVVTFIVSIVLARILNPSDYGIVAIILTFTTLASVFVTCGFSVSLIQKHDADYIDYSSIFYVQLLLGIILYVVLFFTAPYISLFYENKYSELVPMLRVLSLQIPITSVNNMQQTYISKHLIFRKLFISSLIGGISSGVIGIVMAYSGFGGWALVAQYLCMTIINTIVLLFIIPWHPTLRFSFERVIPLLRFGWKVLMSELISAIYVEIRALIIGKKYTSEELAYYNKGKQIPSLLISNINTTIQSVMFPAIADIQHNPNQVKNAVRRSIRISTYIVCPLLIGLASVSEPLIRVLLTDKWVFCVPYMQIICFAYVFYPMLTTSIQAVKALGRSDIVLKTEIVKKTIELILIIVAYQKGVLAITFTLIISSLFGLVINGIPNVKCLGYTVKEQCQDIASTILLSIIMGGVSWTVTKTGINSFLVLALSVTVGIITYLGLSVLTHNQNLAYIKREIDGLLQTKKKQ